MRKSMVWLLAVCLIFALVGTSPAWAAESVAPITVLEGIERLLYGRVQDGSLVDRLSRVEKDVYGELKVGALITRINTVADFLAHGDDSGIPLRLQLNAVEWMMYQQLNAQVPLLERVGSLELGLLGQVQSGPVVARIRKLVDMVWPGGKLNVEKVVIPAHTLVKIRLLGRLDSATSRVGDTVTYRVVEDVRAGRKVVIPAGTVGTGRVTEVAAAGPMGKSGRINVDFGQLSAIDGTPVPVQVGEKATAENQTSTALATGASIAGVLLLGPVGLVGGYFVRGKDVVIETNTEFYIEVSQEVEVAGLSLEPVSE